MIKFKDFLREQIALGCFNIGRKQMPQINDQKDFERYLKRKNIYFEKKPIRTETIEPTQIEFDQEKVNKMPLDANPIIISKDFKVLDGHHRYFKHKQKKQETINAIKVDMNINELLNLCNEYNYIE